MHSKHEAILRQLVKFRDSKISYLSEGSFGKVYDIDDKYIAKFAKPRADNRITFNDIVTFGNLLKIIQKNVSFSIPTYDWIARIEEEFFIIYKKIIGELLNFSKLSDAQIRTFLQSFSQGLYELHHIDMDEFKQNGLKPTDLKKFFDINIKDLRFKLKDIAKKSNLNESVLNIAIEFVDRYAGTVKPANAQTITHGDLNNAHIYIDSRTKKLSGLIDFDFVGIREPSADFCLLNKPLFESAYEFYPNKKLLGRNKSDAVIRQQVYHVLKILWHLRDIDFVPEEYRETACLEFPKALEQALEYNGLI